MVLRVTVLPPVFDPVIISVLKFFPIEISFGTTSSITPIKIGCLTDLRLIKLSLFTTGSTAFSFMLKRARAKIKSRRARTSTVDKISALKTATSEVSRVSTRVISALILISVSFIKLFKATSSCGSMNTVEPLEETS